MDGLGDSKLEARVRELVEFHERKKELYALPDASLVAGVKRWYSAREAATFFSRSSTWIYNRLEKKQFTYEDGTPIVPRRVGNGPKPRMRFDLQVIRDMAESCFRDGIVSMTELRVIFRKVLESEYEERLPETNGHRE